MSKEEAREIQRKLRDFNKNGCMVSVWLKGFPADEPSVFSMVDSVFCIRVNNGLPVLLFLSVGYDETGMSAVHMIEVAEIVYIEEPGSEGVGEGPQ